MDDFRLVCVYKEQEEFVHALKAMSSECRVFAAALRKVAESMRRYRRSDLLRNIDRSASVPLAAKARKKRKK